MKHLWILVFLLWANISGFAQKESTTIKKNNDTAINAGKQIPLSNTQQQWLNSNYKKIASLKKDDALNLVRVNFTNMPEAGLEYMISQAAKLSAADNQRQAALLNQQLDQLKKQKQSLVDKIKEKQDQSSGEEMGKKVAKEKEMTEAKSKLREVEDRIRYKEQAVKQLKVLRSP